MRSCFRPGRLAWALCLGAALLVPRAPVCGQAPATPQTPQTPTPPTVEPKKEEATTPTPSTDTSNPNDNNPSDNQSDTGDSASSFDSAVGYIDDAVPSDMVRFRFDDAFHDNRPTRAEYFYAKGGPNGPGFGDYVGILDYQEISAYVEGKLSENFSMFLNVPYRLIEPQLDTATNGFGDLDAGFKWAFYRDDDTLVTFQFRTYAPSGDAADGLGTRHVSLEPALLWNHRVNDMWRLEGEFRYWSPIGGTDFSGEVLRYGVGVSYGEHDPCGFWLTPVVEFVGWTVLGGQEQTGPLPTDVKSSSGDTIVNGKFGVRAGWGERVDVYAGYGRALTGAYWYKDLVRVEVRLHF